MDSKLSNLPAASIPFSGSELFYAVQTTSSVKVTTDQLFTVAIKSVALTNYTFVATDAQAHVRFTAGSAVTARIDPAIFSVGTQLAIEQAGAGVLSVVGGTGVTILPASPISAAGQNSIIGFIQVSTNSWVGFGDKL